MAENSAAAPLLRAALGFGDVDAVVSTLRSLPAGDVRPYLDALLDAPAQAHAIALALESEAHGGAAIDVAKNPEPTPSSHNPSVGFVAYRKGEDEPAGPSRLGVRAAAPPIVGGASAAPVAKGGTAEAPNKRERQAARANKGKPVGAGGSEALLPGRQLCRCNARRHGLLYNCLACGAVVCEQQRDGECLFCGRDPHTALPPGGDGAPAGGGGGEKGGSAGGIKLGKEDTT